MNIENLSPLNSPWTILAITAWRLPIEVLSVLACLLVLVFLILVIVAVFWPKSKQGKRAAWVLGLLWGLYQRA